ncbi:MAG: flagellar biosynthesis anti-sigma factor FlgM [Bdellovibrionota bacterium]
MKVPGTPTGSPERARNISNAGNTGAVAPSKERKQGGTPVADVDSKYADKVAISGRAKDAARAKEVASSAPDVDEAKVARLKAAIEGKSYNIDADKIADRLVDEHLFGGR